MERTMLDRRALLRSGLAACAAAAARDRTAEAMTEAPAVEITNGPIRAKLYLPDAEQGYYRGTRFDWSGIISSLEYGGHTFYGPWFDRIDPPVRDFSYAGSEIVAGRASAVTGPVQEFIAGRSELGYEEAPPGGTFIKIGVGVLRRPRMGDYDRFGTAEIVDPGKWRVNRSGSEIEFIHELTDPASGYAYRYRKRVRLLERRPVMVMDHTLTNTGRKAVRGEVYNHNFLVLDRLPTGPDFEISVPFVLHSDRPADPSVAAIQGSRILYRKTLQGRDTVAMPLRGFGDSARDYDIRIDHRQTGAGVRVTGDRPLSRLALWSIRSTLCMEPFIRIDVEPGNRFTWKYTYEYSAPGRG
jgi:hypothetical protein